MSEPRIYTGAEALALREAAEHPVAPSHTHTLTLTTGETALLHAAPDLAASVAHHEARAQRAEAERDRWRDALRRCAARCDGSVATGPDDVDGLTSEVIDELRIVDEAYGSAQRVAESAWEALGLGDGMPRVAVGEDAVCEAIEARGAALIADRDAALAHAAELERALREALRDRDRAEERSRLHAADANRAAERWASANGRIAAADVELATACRLRDDAGRLADALRAERDALRAAVREEMAAEREARGGIRHIAARDALRRLATEAPDAR